MPRALLSVTDKSDLVPFAQALSEQGYELISTGGTAKLLRQEGLTVLDVAEITGFPEMLDGRVKTLHPMVHGGLLGDRTNPDHVKQMEEAGIVGIDIVCVNLYAFEKTIQGSPAIDEAIESIDIGGPAMIRAAAKNWKNTAVVTDPADYDRVAEAAAAGQLSDLRLSLSAKAYRHTAFYDSMISRWMTEAAGESAFSDTLTVGYRRSQELRYGENPHQEAAVYHDPMVRDGAARSEQLWGKALSYNNLLDADAAWELACDLPEGSCAVIKHGNPCGASAAGDLAESYRLARAADPISAFGGIAALHGTIDKAAAEMMTEKGNFLEVVIGADWTDEALEIFKTRKGWGQNVRLLNAAVSPNRADLSVRSVRGGALVQHTDEDPAGKWVPAGELKPTEDQLEAMKLAWKMIPHIKSNGILITDKSRLLGVGAGQMNRVQSVRLALEQAGDQAEGAVLASDAFFPFPDSIETAAAAGIKAVIQPGGSKKDNEVIAAADKLGIAMILTGVRHFRH